MNNNGNYVKMPKARHNWAVFDSLPREVKEYYWYNPLRLTPGSIPVLSYHLPSLRERGDKAVRQSCYLTYGPDHPQAEAPLPPRAAKRKASAKPKPKLTIADLTDLDFSEGAF